jgi:DNA gyrase subunit B
MSKSYGAESIQVLEDLEHVRKRPGMYIGSQDSDGVRHILKEVVDNSIDEWLAGYAKSIEVEVNSKEHTFRVLDDGRGIPIEKHKKTGQSTLITVFTNLQAGGKFEKQSYAVSAGLHGVGLKATNALSEWLVARVWRSGVCYEQHFERGQIKTKEPQLNKELNQRGRSGTEVSFHPDTQIFGKHQIDVARVQQWLEETSHLCPGLKIKLVTDGKEQSFESAGLSRLVQVRARTSTVLHDPIALESKDRRVSAAFLWTEDEGENWFSACNASSTPEGGKHVDGAMRAISDVLGPYSKKKAIDVRDLVDGLYAAVQVLVAEPQFKSQTKDKLLNAEVRDEVYNVVYPQLKAFFDQNKKLAEKIVARAIQIKKARESYKKLRTVINQTSSKKDARGVLPDKLVEAMHCSPEERELFIVEGDSAGGSAKVARDPDYQEVLPLKGKIPNAVQTAADKLLQHTEVAAILKATGAQLGPKGKDVDLSNVRVGKVLLLMDADPDGSHIASLALTFFCTWLTEFVRRGYLYVVDSPLFVGVYKDQRWYAHNLQQLEALSGRPVAQLQVSRLKGHGEASAEELRHYAMNPATRKLWKISLGSDDKEIILSLMGSDSSARKTLLGLT